MMKPKIPKGQVHQETLCATDGTVRQIITSNAVMSKWYLYDVDKNGSLTKIETGDSPLFRKRVCK